MIVPFWISTESIDPKILAHIYQNLVGFFFLHEINVVLEVISSSYKSLARS